MVKAKKLSVKTRPKNPNKNVSTYYYGLYRFSKLIDPIHVDFLNMKLNCKRIKIAHFIKTTARVILYLGVVVVQMLYDPLIPDSGTVWVKYFQLFPLSGATVLSRLNLVLTTNKVTNP